MSTQTVSNDLFSNSAAIVDILLAAHREPSDRAARPLAAALREWGLIIAEAGRPATAYLAIVDWDGDELVIDDNNALTRVIRLEDADIDVQAAINEMTAADSD